MPVVYETYSGLQFLLGDEVRQQNQDDDIQEYQQCHKQSLTGHHPPEADAAGEDKQEDRDNPGDRLQLEGGEDSWTNRWSDLTVTSGHHGLGTSGFGSLGGIQARSLLSSSTVHQRIMSVGRKPLVEEGGGMAAHIRPAP